MTLEEENALLHVENAALREQMAALVEHIRDLEARLAMWSGTATTAANRSRRMGSSGSCYPPAACGAKPERGPAANSGIVARRCIWWRSPTPW